jgi:hypothetical protein
VLNSQRNLNMLARLGEERFMINGYQEEKKGGADTYPCIHYQKQSAGLEGI